MQWMEMDRATSEKEGETGSVVLLLDNRGDGPPVTREVRQGMALHATRASAKGESGTRREETIASRRENDVTVSFDLSILVLSVFLS